MIALIFLAEIYLLISNINLSGTDENFVPHLIAARYDQINLTFRLFWENISLKKITKAAVINCV